MIFDVKMEDFCCNVRLVTGEHMSDTPQVVMYSTIVSRETICIAISIPALNAHSNDF